MISGPVVDVEEIDTSLPDSDDEDSGGDVKLFDNNQQVTDQVGRVTILFLPFHIA